jgi:hypothetical protein
MSSSGVFLKKQSEMNGIIDGKAKLFIVILHANLEVLLCDNLKRSCHAPSILSYAL